jgi:anion-transporting  ArsA/GET3 family ATPase
VTPLLQWIDAHRVLVCLWPGGVGKTTVTSALGLCAARSGRRTLCLTIDPARRLAESLGVMHRGDAQSTMVEVPVCPNLWAMMVDAEGAVDVATRRHLRPEAAAGFETNRIFGYLRNTLAGFHEFACMDVLVDLVDRGVWDSIVLDTPPSRHAMDFLEAPRRIEEAVTSPVLNLFIDAGGRGLPGRGIVGLGTGMTMRVVGRLIGQGLVEEVAEFLILGGDMLRGFHVRSQRMQEFLSTADLGFAVVTSPETVPECLRLHAMLREMGFENEFFVANRVLAYADEGASGLRQLAHSPPGRAGRAPHAQNRPGAHPVLDPADGRGRVRSAGSREAARVRGRDPHRGRGPGRSESSRALGASLNRCSLTRVPRGAIIQAPD